MTALIVVAALIAAAALCLTVYLTMEDPDGGSWL